MPPVNRPEDHSTDYYFGTDWRRDAECEPRARRTIAEISITLVIAIGGAVIVILSTFS